MTTKKQKQKTLKLEGFKKLWKTKKALEQLDDKELRQEILKAYRTKCHKPQGGITRKDLADRVFSEYRRLLDADENGLCVCVTCKDKMPWEEIQCGHFVTRGVMKYRFDVHNTECQCYKCNCILNGNYKEYTLFMIDKYGREKVEEMLNDKTIKEYKQYEYEDMIIERYQFITKRKEKEKRTKKVLQFE